MHASLASIGRACTVEDEEPPETPTHSSIDSQTEYTEQFLKPPGWTARELVEKASSLVSNPPPVWPYVRPTQQRKTDSNQATEHEAVEELLHEPVPSSSYTHVHLPPAAEVHLDRLTRLHRLCELARRTFHLDALSSTYYELSSGLANLSIHSDNITVKEYELLEATLSDYSRAYVSPFTSQSDRSPYANNQTMKYAGTSGCGSTHGFASSVASVYPYSCFRTPTASSPSQLDELRVICESLRQCLTQIKRFFHEQQNTDYLVRHFPQFTNAAVSDLFRSPAETITRDTNQLTSVTLLSAHNLVYAGLSLLAHSDITRYTHGEMWEMTRGIEELDILNRQLQNACRMVYSESLCNMIMRSHVDHKRRTPLLENIINNDLLHDPILIACPISVGYLFTLIAYQRSFRLAHSIFQQLSAVRSFDHQGSACATETATSAPISERLTLVEAFRVYLNQNYDRTASEYLRNEYEFIAGFLDVLSQSTNLLYQVQKLKLLCSAAAVAQAKKTELDRQNQHSRFLQTKTNSESSHALSVEGVHGILVKRKSIESESSLTKTTSTSELVTVTNKTTRCVRKVPSTKRSAVSQYQETLHRIGTLDRYVATGSVNCPLSSTDPMENEELRQNTEGESDPLISADTESKSAITKSVKKAVQWSDHREIGTRHQVIGRFLEMTWRYTESNLINLFICPPMVYAINDQSHSFNTQSSVQMTETELSVAGLGRRCSTISCLIMKSNNIRTLSGYIREVAKPDLFPAGLIPALKRQALRLEELAHRHDWFTEVRSIRFSVCDSNDWLTLKLNTPADQPSSKCIGGDWNHKTSVDNTQPSDAHFHTSQLRNSSLFGPDETASTYFTLEPSGTKNCAVSYLRNSHKLMADLCPNCYPQQKSWPILFSELTTILQLTIDMMIHFTKNRAKVETLLKIINSHLTDLDFTAQCKQVATINAELACQPDVLLQSAYDLSRRLNLSAHRFHICIKSMVQQRMQEIHNAMHCTCTTLIEVEPFNKLLCKVPSAARVIAQLIRLFSLIQVLCHAIETTIDMIRSNTWRVYQGGLSYSDENHAACVPNRTNESCIQSIILPQFKIRLTNGIRLTRIVSVLKRFHNWMIDLRTLLPESIFTCSQMCNAHFVSMLNATSSRPNECTAVDESMTTLCQSPAFLDSFVHSVLTVLPPCSMEVPVDSANINNLSTDPDPVASLCAFHQIMYKEVLGKMFGHVCSHWLNSVCHVHDSAITEPLSDQHINAIEKLRNLVMESRQSRSVELLAVLCDCPEFQALLTSTTLRSDHKTTTEVIGQGIPEISNRTEHKQLPSTTTASPLVEFTTKAGRNPEKSTNVASISHHISTVMTPRAMKNKLSSKLNAHGEALAAFAAGVKNSLFNPLKQFAAPDSNVYNPPSTMIEPTSSVEVMPSAVKSPSTGPDT